MSDLPQEISKLELKEGLFSEIKFFVSGEVDEQVVELLKNGGAERLNYFSDYVTHLIVGENPEETDIVDANDVYEIPAVTPKWILICAALQKLVSLKPYLYAANGKLFSQFTFCFSQIREDRNLLWALITYNGGRVQLNFDKNCQFLVATDMKGPKVEKAEELGPGYIKIVTPDWVVEAVKNNSFPDTALFHPKLINWPRPIEYESTAAITGFEPEQLSAEEKVEEKVVSDSTQALLDKLKQRMPWNQPKAPTTTPMTSSSDPVAPPNVVAPSFMQKTQQQLQQPGQIQKMQPPTSMSQQQTQPQQIQSTPQSPVSSSFPQIPHSPTTSLNNQVPKSIIHHTPNQQQQQNFQQQQISQQPQQQQQQHPLNINRLIGQPQPRSSLQLRGQLGQTQLHQQLLQQQQQQQQNQGNVIQRGTTPQVPIPQQLFQQQLAQRQLAQRQLLQNQLNQNQLLQQQINTGQQQLIQNPQQITTSQHLSQLTQQQIAQLQQQQLQLKQNKQLQLSQNQQLLNQNLQQIQLNQGQQQLQLNQNQQIQLNQNQQQIQLNQNQQQIQLNQNQQQIQLNQNQQQIQLNQNQQQIQLNQNQQQIQLNQNQQQIQLNQNQQQVQLNQNQQQIQLTQNQQLQLGQGQQQIQLNPNQQIQISQNQQQLQLTSNLQQITVNQGQQVQNQPLLQNQVLQSQGGHQQQNQIIQQQSPQQIQLSQAQGFVQQNVNQHIISQQSQQILQQKQFLLNQHQTVTSQPQFVTTSFSQNQDLNQQGLNSQSNISIQSLNQQLSTQNLGQQLNQQQLTQQLTQQNPLGQQIGTQPQQTQLVQQLTPQDQIEQRITQQTQLNQLAQQNRLSQQTQLTQQISQSNQLSQQSQQITQQSQLAQQQITQQNQLAQQQLNQVNQQQIGQPSTISQATLDQELGSLNQQLNQGLNHQIQQQLNRQTLQQQQQQQQQQQIGQQPLQVQQQGIGQQNLQQQQLNQINQQVNPGLQQVVRTQFQQQPNIGQQILINQPTAQNPNAQRPQISQHIWSQQPTQIAGQQIIRHPVNVIQQPGGPRVQWSPTAQQGNAVPQRQFIQLDARTHQELQKMPPEQQALFVARLQRNRQLLKQVQQRGGGSHILIRGNVPPGLTTQQQVQWLQQQAKQQGIVLPPNIQQQNITPGTLTQQPALPQNMQHAPGLSPINQNTTQFTDQNQQQQIQLRQFRLQQLQMQREQAQKNHLAQQGTIQQTAVVRPIGQSQLADSTTNIPHVQEAANIQSPLVVNAKTKTALANMLSIKLQSGGSSVGVQRPDAIQEPSAAGTLRLMTAQHNAAINSKPQEIIALQRRTISGPNGEIIKPPGAQPHPPTPTTEPPKLQYCPKPSLPLQHRPGPFYGHNPNLKLPTDLFLLGCVFVVVELEDFLEEKIPGWQQKIAKHGGEVEKQYCNRVTHVLCETQRHGVVMQALRDCKRCVTIIWLSDVMQRKQVLPPWTALHLPNIYLDTTPAAKHLISISGFEGNDRARVKQMIKYTGAKCTSYFSKHNTLLISAKCDGKKCSYAKKWQIPVVNVQWLTDIMLGHFTALNQLEHQVYQQFPNPPNFSFDPKLVPNLMVAWKAPINISQESYERVKRSASPVVTPKKPKKPKIEPTDENDNISDEMMADCSYKILFSLVADVKKMKQMVKELGGCIAKDHRDFTHLVMPQLARTNKLFFAIAKEANVVSEHWLRDSHDTNQFLPENKYALHSKDFNFEYKCDIDLTLQTRNRNKLFEGKFFYVTPSVFPSKRIVVELIQCCGGIVEKHRRSASQIEATSLNSPYSYFIITHEEDLHLVADLLRNKKDKMKIVCNAELIFSAVLKQTFEIEPYAVCVL